MRVIVGLVLLVAVLLPAAAQAAAGHRCAGNGSELQQLRIYQISRENRDAFHRQFHEHALRIMQRHGFRVLDLWESESDGKIEFVYVLAWPDAHAMESGWDSFRADPEWIRVKEATAAEAGETVHSITARPLHRVAYSPQCAGE